ncbi:MAG TPA: serine hydrolase domain-containing protein [Labilithrix sp.]|nr:serine hydrolase domain-containing protein [Labilithrix sp.]
MTCRSLLSAVIVSACALSVLGGTGCDASSAGQGPGPDAAASPSPGPDAGPDASSTCDSKQTAELQAAFDSAAPEHIDAVAVVKDPSCGVRFFTRGPSKYSPEVLHVLASNIKTYVASLMLLLAEDGLFLLDDPISTWIDGVPGGDAIHIRHLLNHTSGLYNFTDAQDFWNDFDKHYTPAELVELAFREKVAFAPDERFDYSNTNYVLLGMIAEKVTGRHVEELLRERILTPIGAKATFFHGKEPLVGELALGRSFIGGDGATFQDPSAHWCSGSLVGTPLDLANWIELRGSGKFHTPEAQAEILKLVPGPLTTSWGAGVMVVDPSGTAGGGTAYGHGGDLVGYHSYGFYFPSRATTVVVVVDSDEGPEGAFPVGPYTYRELLFPALIGPLFRHANADGGDGRGTE